ncbi:unnamed protein product [Brassica rapa]|uniref:Uncharacterized protein n=1 Tax=Brassica campestris TaxID=3711 RepID=A0A3P6BFB1_BRACM|nr:unnamed protein product [Brassica rapa]VDD01668.1 unnamed protein product [Brassica rapa]
MLGKSSYPFVLGIRTLSSYLITTTYLHSNVGKLKDAMSNTYSQLEAMKESVQFYLRHHVSLLVRPMQHVSFFQLYLLQRERIVFYYIMSRFIYLV